MDGAAAAIRHRTVEANGIAMHVAESGAEGSPRAAVVASRSSGTRGATRWGTWPRGATAAWRPTSAATAAPTRRPTSPPTPPSTSSRSASASQLKNMLAALELDGDGKPKMVFVVGHDWGAIIAWYLCLFRPDRVTALVNTSVAFMRHIFIRAAAVKPTDFFNRTYGPTYYICRFQEPGVAEEFSPANARYIVRQILCNRFTSEAAGGAKPAAADEEPLPPWLTEADVDQFASEFERTGLTGGVEICNAYLEY